MQMAPCIYIVLVMHKVMLPINSRAFRRFNLEEVIYLKAWGNYTFLIKREGRKILLSVLLKQIEDKLRKKGFYRLSRSYLINLNHVEEYYPRQECRVVMSDGTSIEIPRRKKKVFREIMEERYTHL